VHIRVTGDALHVADACFTRLAERDTGVLSGVVIVDVGIALALT